MLTWFLNNSSDLNLKVHRYHGVKHFLSRAFDYLVTLEISGDEIWGRGVNEDETSALEMACAEAVEHATLVYQQKRGREYTSNGIAAHLNAEEAKQGAIGELIERDSFFSHYLTEVPFREIPLPPCLWDTKDILEAEGISFRIAKMNSPANWHSVIAACFCKSSHKQFGVFIGTATKRSLDQAIAKASKEAIIFVSEFLGSSRPIGAVNQGPLFHYKLATRQDSANRIQKLFENTDRFSNEINIEKITTETLALHPAFEGCPVTVVRASSPDAQQLFFGETRPEHINFKRLSQFLGKEVRWEDVNKTTHVFA